MGRFEYYHVHTASKVTDKEKTKLQVGLTLQQCSIAEVLFTEFSRAIILQSVEVRNPFVALFTAVIPIVISIANNCQAMLHSIRSLELEKLIRSLTLAFSGRAATCRADRFLAKAPHSPKDRVPLAWSPNINSLGQLVL